MSVKLPDGGSEVVGSDKISAGDQLIFSMLIGHFRWIGLFEKVWSSHHTEFREKSTQLGLLLSPHSPAYQITPSIVPKSCRGSSNPLLVPVTSRLHSDLYPTYDVRVLPGSRVSELGE